MSSKWIAVRMLLLFVALKPMSMMEKEVMNVDVGDGYATSRQNIKCQESIGGNQIGQVE